MVKEYLFLGVVTLCVLFSIWAFTNLDKDLKQANDTVLWTSWCLEEGGVIYSRDLPQAQCYKDGNIIGNWDLA